MASLDFLERKLLKIIAETDSVRLKRQWVSRHVEPFPEIEQRKRIALLLSRLDKLPASKRQEVRDLLNQFNWNG
ncbi:hypothetical protein AV540_02185 [Brevibacillus parabrevis]|uniref:hypothetical protein n=1 Tax=Brevibacillus parabrevis TaxID=54914 RepID=UPI0007AB72ED|nr:hypothetical protein [Brevibacillus parabrevis]KZE44130.1 hypothetical protein AV540_02185 [Brevibacillus parabrevis]